MHIGNKYVHWQTTLPTVTIVTLVDIFQMVFIGKVSLLPSASSTIYNYLF